MLVFLIVLLLIAAMFYGFFTGDFIDALYGWVGVIDIILLIRLAFFTPLDDPFFLSAIGERLIYIIIALLVLGLVLVLLTIGAFGGGIIPLILLIVIGIIIKKIS